jgi:hypothetical protein
MRLKMTILSSPHDSADSKLRPSILKNICRQNLRRATLLLLTVVTINCGGGSVQATSSNPPQPPASNTWPLTDAQVANLVSQRTFFGHQSVGGNIIQGISDLMAADSRLTLNMVSSANPASVTGPAFIESVIGQNGDPSSKNAAFAAIINNGYGAQGGIAMYKYCWVDISDSTDVNQMFADYRNTVDTLKAKYPALNIVHITAPLSTDVSMNRNTYNKLLRQTYPANSIFDLAEVESTHVDGSRSYTVVAGEPIYTLTPEYTDDGGHLNATGRQPAAKKMLITLANQ